MTLKQAKSSLKKKGYTRAERDIFSAGWNAHKFNNRKDKRQIHGLDGTCETGDCGPKPKK